MVDKSKITARYKALFGSVGLSATRLDAIAAKLSAKMADESDDDAIDVELNDLNEVYPFADIKKNDDRTANDKNNPNKKKDDASAAATASNDPDEPAWFKTYREAQDAKFAQLEQANVGKSRKEIASTKLAKYPKEMKEDLLADIDSMNFADDEAFNSFLERKEATFKSIAEKSKLDMFGEDTPPGADATPADKKGKVKEIDADMAAKIAAG